MIICVGVTDKNEEIIIIVTNLINNHHLCSYTLMHVLIYRIAGNIGGNYVWQIARK